MTLLVHLMSLTSFLMLLGTGLRLEPDAVLAKLGYKAGATLAYDPRAFSDRYQQLTQYGVKSCPKHQPLYRSLCSWIPTMHAWRSQNDDAKRPLSISGKVIPDKL